MEDEDFDEFKEATQTNGDSLNVKTEIMLPNENEIINENENFDEKLGVSVENLNEIKTKEQHFSTELNEKENETEDNIEEVIENRAISEKAKDEIFNDMNEKTNEQTKALLKENFNKDFIENDNNFAANEGLEVKELKENNLSCENEDQEVKLKRNCQISNDNLFEKPLENKFVQQHIIFDEMFSQTKIDNGLTYYDKGISNSNENKIIFDAIKVNDDPFEIEKNDIKEILKIEASIPYEFDIQEKNRNLNESKQNIISRSDEHIIIMPESIPEVIKHNETIFEAKEESSKIDFFREVNEEIENQTKDPLFDQEEERKDLQISPDRDNEIDREEQNRLIPERTNLELISKDGLLPEDEERKLVVNSYENKDKENLLEEQKEYSIKDEKNINMEQLLDNKRKELEENDIFRNFEENQDQNNMPIQSEKEEIELEKEKDETVLKKLQSPKNSLTNDDKNLKVIVQNFENEDDNDNDKDENDNFGEFEEHRPITQKNIFETENLIQNNQNNPKESEPKIIEKNLTIAENEQNSNQIPISKISEIKNENEDSFGNFEENNFCDSEAKSENPNVILSITKAEVANSELKDQEIKLNEPKMEKECRIQEIDFDEGFDDFQGEQKKIEENDKEGEMEKKSIENKENKDESLSIDFGDFEESNINEQEIQSFSQNQKEFKNLEDQKKLTEKNKIETINFEPDSSNLDFNFQPINNNSSTFEFPIFTSTVSLNPNFNFEAIIQAKLPDELNLPEAKRTDIATDDLDFFDEMEVEKEREEILEERSKKEDYVLLSFNKKVNLNFFSLSPFLEGKSMISAKILMILKMLYFLLVAQREASLLEAQK